MKSLESFIKKNQPKKRVSQLKKYEKETLELYATDYQVEQIQEFLISKNIKISTRRIYKFIEGRAKKNFSIKNPSAAGTAKKSEEKGVAESPQNSKAISAYKAKMQKLAERDN